VQIKSVKSNKDDRSFQIIIDGIGLKSNFEMDADTKEECYNYVVALNYYASICKSGITKQM
jgi:hypothetical protein